jgi:acetylornithine deacetylase/succinyl-diaminopimelate desuccinylase-like protein
MSPTKLLQELIALPSVNPAFSNDKTIVGEQRVADFIAAQATRAGFDVEFKSVFTNRANVVVRCLPRGKIKQRILLAPHMDTVGVARDQQLEPRKHGAKLFGRGACDTKGSIAMMLAAVCDLSREKHRPLETEIIFAGLIDEENEQSGSRALVASGLKANLAIVGEPTELQVVTAHKGDLWLRLETRGRSAHGATPHLGKNAVHEMARIVELLETVYARQLRGRRHVMLGFPTINVGSIQGGTQPNIVPDHCVISADRRTLPGESEAGVRRELHQLFQQHKLRARIVGTKAAACPPMETNPRLPLVQALLSCAGRRQPIGVDFFCDAAVLAGGGIPSVVFGPGDIAQAHTVDEWISLPQLERGRHLLAKFLRSLR